jgi:hypothetical protein
MRGKTLVMALGLAGGFAAAGCENRPLTASRAVAVAQHRPTETQIRVVQDPPPSAGQAYAPSPSIPGASNPGARVSSPGIPSPSIPSPSIPGAHAPGANLPRPSQVAAPAQVPARPVSKTEIAPPPAPLRAAPRSEAPAPRPQVPAPRQQTPASSIPAAPTPPTTLPDLPPAGKQTQLDTNAEGETVIITTQSTEPARPLIVAAEKPKPAEPAPQEITTPRAGVCTLSGEVQEFRRTWRLRYAAIDAEDAHGGSVILTGEGLSRLRDGQSVRVVGALAPAEDRSSPPRFQVQFLEVINP